MKNVLRGLVYVVMLMFIFGNVYVATLPSTNVYRYTTDISKIGRAIVIEQITDFTNWHSVQLANNVIIDTDINKVNPLANTLKVQLNNRDKFSVQNQLISDTLIVQHIYGLSGSKASAIKWKVKGQQLSLNIHENISGKQKLWNSFGLVNSKSNFIKKNYKNLTAFLLGKKVSPNKELQLLNSEKSNKSFDTIIRLPKQN